MDIRVSIFSFGLVWFYWVWVIPTQVSGFWVLNFITIFGGHFWFPIECCVEQRNNGGIGQIFTRTCIQMQIIVRQGTVSFDELKWNTDYVVQLYSVFCNLWRNTNDMTMRFFKKKIVPKASTIYVTTIRSKEWSKRENEFTFIYPQERGKCYLIKLAKNSCLAKINSKHWT